MNAVQAQFVLLKGAHCALHTRVVQLLDTVDMLDQTDMIAAEDIGLALADPKHIFHEAALLQVETSVRLHNTQEIMLVGPTNWGTLVARGESFNPTEEMNLLWTAKENVEHHFPQLKTNRTPIVLRPTAMQAETPIKKQTLYYACIDLRYVQGYLNVARNRGENSHLAALAGATGAITDIKSQTLAEYQVEALQPSDIVFAPHWDCGKFGGVCGNPRSHFKKHSEEARKAAQAIRARFPYLQLECHILHNDRLIPLRAG